jgi:hypothetical protein
MYWHPKFTHVGSLTPVQIVSLFVKAFVQCNLVQNVGLGSSDGLITYKLCLFLHALFCAQHLGHFVNLSLLSACA